MNPAVQGIHDPPGESCKHDLPVIFLTEISPGVLRLDKPFDLKFPPLPKQLLQKPVERALHRKAESSPFYRDRLASVRNRPGQKGAALLSHEPTKDKA